ncbi:DUF4468 domain-containing protein [Pseudidiomarina sp. 1APP75-27a]|uniref:DUF4468 domain-containing protein n=1 Tax=Pseudidiomarina terrestris TaxID=2820060 RepID=UPI002B056CCD|nr:DUF4468 domain-containing protein [Pseudidiomarina sp. 1APP75-27a]MEA3587943.1 DUF4468 domain-containing protein [Pseudidiomarina sp. 1APP75-27a]
MNIRSIAFGTAALVLTLTGCQATTPYTPETVTNVVEVSESQETIYNKARQWFSEYFVSGESVIDYEDPSTGTIIGNGVATIGTDPFGLITHKINFSVRVDTKDNKFKVEYKIIKHTNTSDGQTYDVVNVSEDRREKAKQEVEKITADLRQYIQSSSANDDW